MKIGSTLSKILTGVGFVKCEDFEGEFWKFKRDGIDIVFVPSDFNDGTSIIDITWSLPASKGQEMLINTNPATVLAEFNEHFTDRADTKEIADLAEDIMNKISAAIC